MAQLHQASTARPWSNPQAASQDLFGISAEIAAVEVSSSSADARSAAAPTALRSPQLRLFKDTRLGSCSPTEFGTVAGAT